MIFFIEIKINILFCFLLGYGVFTKTTFEKGAFLLEYRGTLMTSKEADILEQKHARVHEGCYMFFFNFNGRKMWYLFYYFLMCKLCQLLWYHFIWFCMSFVGMCKKIIPNAKIKLDEYSVEHLNRSLVLYQNKKARTQRRITPSKKLASSKVCCHKYNLKV